LWIITFGIPMIDVGDLGIRGSGDQ